MGALEAGVINPEEALGGGSCITAGAEQFCNSGKTDYGALPLVEALKVSSDTYFFTVGEYANSHGDVIQNMAKELGIGKETAHRPAERDRRDGARRQVARPAEQAAGKLRTQLTPRTPKASAISSPNSVRGQSATTCTWRSDRANC